MAKDCNNSGQTYIFAVAPWQDDYILYATPLCYAPNA